MGKLKKCGQISKSKIAEIKLFFRYCKEFLNYDENGTTESMSALDKNFELRWECPLNFPNFQNPETVCVEADDDIF